MWQEEFEDAKGVIRIRNFNIFLNTGKIRIMEYLRLYYYHWVDTSAVGLLVPEDNTRVVVSVLALTWLIRYNYH
jgi:hypothetical protein